MKIQSVGRESIFSTIKDIILLEDRVCHFVPVTGKGGSGKTMLFNQIREYFEGHADEYPNVIVINYDYRDLRSQSLAGTLYVNVCKLLKHNKNLFPQKAVKLFFRMLLTVPEGKSVLLKFGLRQFEHLIKRGVRLVLLEDTVEVINAPSEFIKNTFQMGAFLPNCVAIVAGRPEENTFEHLDVINSTLVDNDWVVHQPMELPSFTLAETKQFFKMHIGNQPSENLMEKIHLLTAGSPIHLAIVIDVFTQNTNLQILQEDIETLKHQLNIDPQGLISKFEYDLLAQISNLGTTIDWTILYLAYLNRRYDRKIIKLLMGGSDQDIETLEEKYKSLLYLRKSSLPSRERREILHDEIQRMINSLIWEQIDFMKEHRRLITYRVIEGFYKPEIKKHKERLQAIKIKKLDLEDLMKYMDNTFDLAELQNECLDYLLRVNVPEGLVYFQQLAEEANQSEYLEFNRMLLHEGVKNIGLSQFIPKEEIQACIFN